MNNPANLPAISTPPAMEDGSYNLDSILANMGDVVVESNPVPPAPVRSKQHSPLSNEQLDTIKRIKGELKKLPYKWSKNLYWVRCYTAEDAEKFICEGTRYLREKNVKW